MRYIIIVSKRPGHETHESIAIIRWINGWNGVFVLCQWFEQGLRLLFQVVGRQDINNTQEVQCGAGSVHFVRCLKTTFVSVKYTIATPSWHVYVSLMRDGGSHSSYSSTGSSGSSDTSNLSGLAWAMALRTTWALLCRCFMSVARRMTRSVSGYPQNDQTKADPSRNRWLAWKNCRVESRTFSLLPRSISWMPISRL